MEGEGDEDRSNGVKCECCPRVKGVDFFFFLFFCVRVRVRVCIVGVYVRSLFLCAGVFRVGGGFVRYCPYFFFLLLFQLFLSHPI